MADRDKDAVAGAFGNGAGAQVAQLDPGDLGRLGDPEDLVHDRVPDDVDFRIPEQPVLQDLLGAQGVAPVDEGHAPRVVCQIDRFLDRGIAAADDDHLLVSEKEPVAGRAGRHAKPAEFRLARHAEPARLRAGRDNDRLADIAVARIAGRDKRPARQIERGDLIENDAGSDMLGLALHLLHQPGTLDDVGETGIVLDIGRDRHLSAGLHAGDQQRLQIGARGVDRGGVAGRPGADDQDSAVVLLGHAALLLPNEIYST